MKLKYLSEVTVEEVRGNVNHIFDILKNDSSKTLLDIYNGENIFIQSKIDFTPASLINTGDINKDDIENMKLMYDSLKDLNEVNASNKGLWLGLTFGQYYSYMTQRFPLKDAGDFENHYIYHSEQAFASRRESIRQGLSRLWWIPHLTYDASRSNPYELTELYCRWPGTLIRVVESNFACNRDIGIGMLSAFLEYEKTGHDMDRTILRDCVKKVNEIGGSLIIDALSKTEIENIVKKELGI